MRLAGRTALVTGVCGGIGEAVIWALAREGTRVAFVDGAGSEVADRLVSELQLDQHEAVAFQCDTSDEEACEAVVEKMLQRWGKIDILINNASMVRDTVPVALNVEKRTEVINANLNCMYSFCQAVARPMVSARYGRIVNVSSVSAALGKPGEPDCTTGNTDIEGLTRRLAGELAKDGITVNTVAAGFIEADSTASVDVAARDQLKNGIRVERLGRPDDVSNAVLFLAGDEASYITGQMLRVDSGLPLGGF